MTPLRILVYPHDMNIGGSQLNAIELGGAVRDLGHEVVVFSDYGPLVDLVDQLGLEWLPRKAVRRPSLYTAHYLRKLVGSHKFDIVHGYEWPPGMEAAAAVFAGPHAASVCTVMSMSVAPFLPAHMPLVVGTRALQQLSQARRPGAVHLIEPPVDVHQNTPTHPCEKFRTGFGLADEDPIAPAGRIVNVVIVSRLAKELKLEGILTAIGLTAKLARERPVRLVIAGDGDARAIVEQHAREANQYAGWRAVVLTGQLIDPRPAYAAADVMLGMGGSALRALAFGKPLVVQGEQGFWELLTPGNSSDFLQHGWYGIGSGTDGEERLAKALLSVLDNPALCSKLGSFGRQLAVERFSLQQAARVQEKIYRQALATRSEQGMTAHAMAGARSAAGLFGYKVMRRYQRLRGTQSTDDFNTIALAKAALNCDASSGARLRT